MVVYIDNTPGKKKPTFPEMNLLLYVLLAVSYSVSALQHYCLYKVFWGYTRLLLLM